MNKISLINNIALDVKALGGNMYFVGGFVRDKILNIENKDIDVEIFNISSEQLYNILSKYGEVDEVGKSFGILMIKGIDIDFAMPRTEIKTSEGHAGFDITVNPYLSLEDASKRRDFTMNALMQDVLTGEIIDLWGGIEDLNTKTIRHINDTTFVEDPLRVFRACQFASRFDFSINNKTLDLCKTIDVTSLAKERVLEELKKALLKSNKPSIFFKCLDDMNKIDVFFNEVSSLKGVQQPIQYHPEGDAWIHTLMVVDECAKIKDLSTDKFAFMLSGLCHDLGKSISTTIDENGKVSSIGHDKNGIELSKNMISRLTNSKRIINYVTNMTELHMRPNSLALSNSSTKSSRRMFDKSICPEDLILLAKADHLGRLNAEEYDEYEKWLRDRLDDYYNVCKEPLLTGKDLIQMGYKPSKEFKDILDNAYNLQMSGLSKELIIKQLKL